MSATDLSTLGVPVELREFIAGIDVPAYIHAHRVGVDHRWWAREFAAQGLPDVLLASPIARGDLFGLAQDAAADSEGALRLLWNAVVWGSGTNLRHARGITAVAGERGGVGELLCSAARLSGARPGEAYALLRPGDRRNAIGSLGPSFFTKFLYFAGGGNPDHPCCILDQRVATVLHRAGWTSLPTRGPWLASAYQRYNDLLHRWRKPSIRRAWMSSNAGCSTEAPIEGSALGCADD
ncbi:hypothetical protein [Nocardia sp. CA-135398]|uniref:8-oxoguanine DNA glycosylase OGG fold protein n=1 Tax=Nocardia sp. CA-135398 TaxID=3239977 RepID=UPI003D9794D7